MTVDACDRVETRMSNKESEKYQGHQRDPLGARLFSSTPHPAVLKPGQEHRNIKRYHQEGLPPSASATPEKEAVLLHPSRAP